MEMSVFIIAANGALIISYGGTEKLGENLWFADIVY